MVTMRALFRAHIILFIPSFLTVCLYLHYAHLCYTPNTIVKYYKSKYSSYFNTLLISLRNGEISNGFVSHDHITELPK